MIAKHNIFYYEYSKDDYADRACAFMSKIGKDKVIGVTQDRSPSECSVTVWYWEEEDVNNGDYGDYGD